MEKLKCGVLVTFLQCNISRDFCAELAKLFPDSYCLFALPELKECSKKSKRVGLVFF